MTTSTHLLAGVDRHGNGYRVRIRFGNDRHVETGFASADAANRRAIELRELRARGQRPGGKPTDPLLREAAEALLQRKQATVSRKVKRRLRPRGLEWWQRAVRPWLEGEYADTPVSMLRRNSIEDAHLDRALVAAKTARDELYGLKAVLRFAGERGARYDELILGIAPVSVASRRRQALSVAELELLAAGAPDYARRMLLFKGTVGLRVRELFTLAPERVDLAGQAIFVPAEFCKEGVDKWVELTREETRLLRAQLLARPAGASTVFPTKNGLSWDGRYGSFHRLVWAKATLRAAAAWRDAQALPVDARTPFCDLQPHDLRATAATLMRDAGWSREDAAARLGHADSGALLDRIYDQGDRRLRMRRAIAAHSPDGLRSVGAGAAVDQNRRTDEPRSGQAR